METKPNGVSAASKPVPVPAPLPPKPFQTATVPDPIIPMPRRWTDADMQAIVRLAEAWRASNPPFSWKDDAREFCLSIWRETGQYRTPSVVRLRMDALRVLIKVHEGLITGLSRQCIEVHKAKVRYIAEEKEALKKPRAEWPEWISSDSAIPLVGGKNRLQAKVWLDWRLGMFVYARADVDKELSRQEARGFTPDFRGGGLTSLEWERRIMETLAKHGPGSRSTLHLNAAKAKHRGLVALRDLAKSGAILEAPHRGTTFYRLPHHPWPPAPIKLGPRKTKPAPVAAPADERQAKFAAAAAAIAEARARNHPPKPAPTGSVADARADVYRAMRAGEITAKDAAELLRALAQ